MYSSEIVYAPPVEYFFTEPAAPVETQGSERRFVVQRDEVCTHLVRVGCSTAQLRDCMRDDAMYRMNDCYDDALERCELASTLAVHALR